jgi:hypothetical protein
MYDPVIASHWQIANCLDECPYLIDFERVVLLHTPAALALETHMVASTWRWPADHPAHKNGRMELSLEGRRTSRIGQLL